jgi:hypothetical protein
VPTDTGVALSRRSVLRLGLFSALGFTVLGVTPVIRTSHQKVLQAAFDQVFGISSTAAAVDATQRYLAELPLRQQWQVKGLLRAVEWGPLFSQGGRFTRLDPADQRRWLDQLSRSASPLSRQIFTALKQLGAMGIYQLDAHWETLGYPGPLLER